MNAPLRLFVTVLVVVAPLGAMVAPGATAATARRQSAADTNRLPTRHEAPGDDDVESTLPTIRQMLDRVREALLAPVESVVVERDEEALAHDTRQRIAETVRSTPGIHLAGLASRLDVPVSTVRYHVRVLETADVLEIRKLGGRKRLFPVRLGDAPNEVNAALAGDASAAVLRAVARNEPATVTELATDLGRARSTVSYHLCRMAEHGVVVRERTGEAVETSLSPSARRALAGRA